MATEQWNTFMAAALKGDRQAYEQLLRSVKQVITPFLAKRVPPQALDDTLQEVLVRIHAYRDSFDPSRPVKPWVYSIARNVMIDMGKKRQRLVAMRGEADLDQVGGFQADYYIPAQSIQQAMASLPEDQQEALRLTKLEGLSLEEGAARAKVSLSAFRSRAARAAKNFRKHLEGA